MAIEQTLSIIKPDAVRRSLTGKINSRFEESGLKIVAQRRLQLNKGQAEGFYAVHKERSFFSDLCEFMCSGESSITRNRELMGATNPANAEEGTIRKEFGESVEANSVHGSDSSETAAIEIAYFFSRLDIIT